MCLPALPLAIGLAGLAGAGASAYGAAKSASASKATNKQNERIAAANAQAAETEYNKANQKTPDIAAMFARNREAGAQGMGATFLTGAGGAPLVGGNLGGNTLLGS